MNTNNRYAFTMIELVFVIVIIGILSAIALPRLLVTRDDAKIVTMARMIQDGTFEVATYAVAHGEVNDSLSVMSNNFKLMETKGVAVLSTKKAVIHYGDVSDCVILEINTTALSEILQLTPKANGGGSEQCLNLQKIIHPEIYPMQLRGELVEH